MQDEGRSFIAAVTRRLDVLECRLVEINPQVQVAMARGRLLRHLYPFQTLPLNPASCFGFLPPPFIFTSDKALIIPGKQTDLL